MDTALRSANMAHRVTTPVVAARTIAVTGGPHDTFGPMPSPAGAGWHADRPPPQHPRGFDPPGAHMNRRELVAELAERTDTDKRTADAGAAGVHRHGHRDRREGRPGRDQRLRQVRPRRPRRSHGTQPRDGRSDPHQGVASCPRHAAEGVQGRRAHGQGREEGRPRQEDGRQEGRRRRRPPAKKTTAKKTTAKKASPAKKAPAKKTTAKNAVARRGPRR